MRTTTFVLSLVTCLLVAGWAAAPDARQGSAAAVAIDADDIGGVVTGPRGPEAGVWVVAETDDLGTKYRKIVVTDDQGRYVLPDLPDASYRVWVRGYGLVDSERVAARRGRQLPLTAVPAPDARAAAQYYPASYWFSLLKVPEAGAFPIGNVQSQEQWISQAKNIGRFQIGTKATREIPAALKALGFKTTEEALRYYVTAGQMTEMNVAPQQMPYFSEWMERVAAGAVPAAPPRPAGVERNVVITLWDVANTIPFVHDVVSTDKRNPRVNSNGLVYGVEFHNDGLVVLDPVKHTDRTLTIPAEIDKAKMRTFTRLTMDNPSPTWGEEIIVRDHSNPNHLTMDGQGRVWMTAAVNVAETPAYCRAGSANKWAQAQPLDAANRHLAMYDPKADTFTLFHTCIRTHHAQMAVDGTNRIFSNPLGMPIPYFGWLDIGVYEKTRSVEAAQGWCRLYFDTNGDGRGDRDMPVPGGGPYSVIQSPADNSIWGAQPGTPGRIVRLTLGSNPPETCVGESYEVPMRVNGAGSGASGFIPRGIDVDSTGVIWTALAGSGHLASFDRRKCKVLTGEAATKGRHCDEGWTLYPIPGPKFQGVTAEINTDYHYYNFVDQHDAFGMGRDTAFANGTNSDALQALDRRTGKVVTFRVPYPIGFYTRGMDARIDDPNAGWKGRGLWAGNGTRAIWHTETGKGSRSHVVHMQLRPTPLAK
jgi:hypothetical protein